MIDTLYVNGCSWTSGNELDQDPEFDVFLKSLNFKKEDPNDTENWNIINDKGMFVGRFNDYFDKFNWPGRLQKKLNISKLVNESIGAGSNHRMLRKTIDYVMRMPIEKRSTTLIVLGWTNCVRNELYVDNEWQRFNLTQDFSSTADRLFLDDPERLSIIDEFQKFYITHIHDDYASVKEYLQGIYLLSNLLENLRINYFFFNALPPWFNAEECKFKFDVNEEFKIELNEINNNKNILSPDAFNDMFHFTTHNKFLVGKYGHPLFQAHEAWAEKIYQLMLERNTIK